MVKWCLMIMLRGGRRETELCCGVLIKWNGTISFRLGCSELSTHTVSLQDKINTEERT